ncbi:hypothetical protein EV186_11074 [Labedaea rhizosphaerae]|uniref:Uncharacterized protein n=2 Tax=Labedaea rhizosphaerae TaxID=598644 RepID=A0A4R6RUE3_LABRH|nr:hypothetical protein EV186_11074 [Labedaea rhizosphaerae]
MTGLPDHEVRALAAVWHISGSGLQGRVLDKYDSALAVRGQPAFVRGEDPYQSAKLLIELRNYLVHYKVHSTSLDEEHELSAKLKNRFDSNTRREDPNHPWFPDQALGAGCARWAWESATALTSQFEAVMGVALAYSTQPEDFWPDGSGGLL